MEVPKLIIVYGSEDMVCNLASVMELYKHATSKDKTLKIYPGMCRKWRQTGFKGLAIERDE